MQTIQLAIADSAYEATLREALLRSGPWHVESVQTPKPAETGVLVMDEVCLNRVAAAPALSGAGGVAHP